MEAEHWEQVERLYHAALEHAPDARAAFLAEACADDAALRREVATLLACDDRAANFIEKPALEIAAQKFADEPSTMQMGQRISHYQILARLGKGGMGEVFLAQDTNLKRQVAIKLLPAQFTADRQRVERFEREARAASALNHPNILTIHEIGQAVTEAGATHFLVTEYIDGQTLRQQMKGAPMNPVTALDVAIQVAHALQAAHEAHIIHRDIKPENVMVRRDGLVKVLDFGLAKLTEQRSADDSSTASGIVMGTPRYMSPEQARGEKVDARSDIFSFGVMLYEMIAGVPPFVGATTSETLAAILRDEPPPLTTHAPDTPPELQRIVSQALCKERGERYQSIKELQLVLQDLRHELDFAAEAQRRAVVPAEAPTLPAVATTPQKETALAASASSLPARLRSLAGNRWLWLSLVALLVVAGGAGFWYFKRAPVLTEKDTILLADFENQTGEAIFDGMLKQGLAIQLQQTPFLTLLPEARMRHELTLMKRAPNERVTTELARQICERQNLKAYIAGSIAPLGNHFVITLEALNGQSGESLARTQVQAASKEQVLQSLSQAATELRGQLGESLSSIQRFDRSLQEGTTAKPEAFKAYAQGVDLAVSGRLREALPFYHHAVEVDREFAHAYSQIAIMHSVIGQPERAVEFAKKSFELKDRAGEIERSRIIATYHRIATGNLEKAIEALSLHRRTFPREYVGPLDLAGLYGQLGQNELMMAEARESMRLNPRFAAPYRFMALGLLRANRFAEAKDTIAQARAQNLDMPFFSMLLYQIAFIENDASGRQQQIAWAQGRADEYVAYDWQAAAAAFVGRWRAAQELARQSVQMALHGENRELAARFAVEQALRGAVLGECRASRASVTQGLSLDRGRLPLARAALALAFCGESNQAQSLLTELTQRFPEDTLTQTLWLPIIRAALELQRGNAQETLNELQTASRYETAAEFWPQYLRGLAYLQLKQNTEAAVEFQKILDHRGYAPLSVLYPLAQLGLARATQKRKAYDDFFALWKDADADLPVLSAARKEAK